MDYIDFLELAECSIQELIHVGNGSFETYREGVETFKSEHPDIIEQYGLTDSELFVMFMMLIKNFDEIQQCASSGKGTLFTQECVRQYDSFLSKIPVSINSTYYRLEKYYNVGYFDRMRKTGQNFVCQHYLTVSSSSSIFKKMGDGVKLYINKRLIGNSKAHDVFKIYNQTGENQINFERGTKFQIDSVDKKNNTVILTEL